MTLNFNITFDDGDMWRVEDDGHSITAWRPDLSDRDTGLPTVMAITLGQLVDLIKMFREREQTK